MIIGLYFTINIVVVCFNDTYIMTTFITTDNASVQLHQEKDVYNDP